MKIHGIITGLVLALAGPGTFAQDMPATPSTTTTPQSTTDTTTISSAPAMGTGMMGTTPDYSLLVDSSYDYTKLVQAKARGLSDSEIATVAKISRLTGVSFQEITDAVLRGTTFASLAQKYSLPLAVVLDVQDEEAKIAAYKVAYESAGAYAMSSHQSMSSTSSEMSAMESRFQSLYAAIPPTAVGPAMQFPYTPQPPAPVSVERPPVSVPPAPIPAAVPMPAPKIVVHRTVAVHTVIAHKPLVRRRVSVRPKRHIVPRRRIRRVKRVIIGS